MKLPKWLDNFCHYRGKCSCWIDGWFGKDWSSCCAEHDADILGHRTNTVKEADMKLRDCVAKHSKIMAWVMYIGVRPLSWLYWTKKLK